MIINIKSNLVSKIKLGSLIQLDDNFYLVVENTNGNISLLNLNTHKITAEFSNLESLKFTIEEENLRNVIDESQLAMNWEG